MSEEEQERKNKVIRFVILGQALRHRMRPRRLPLLLALGPVLLTMSSESAAESLNSLHHVDLLDELGEPEALPLTREAQLLYPAPGVPSFVAGGGEIVVRFRVRRAMTPPPGIQQHHILADWRARLHGRGFLPTQPTSKTASYELLPYQIRPENSGFVYRLRFKLPPFVTPGVYDLELEGPGIHDSRPRAVRVLDTKRRTLRFYTVPTDDTLWREGEALWLLDPAAILAPGGIREAEPALDLWPLASLTVPDHDDIRACRRLELLDDEAEAIRAAGSCPPDDGRCYVETLGGAHLLDPCGDALADYARSIGPPSWSIGLGDVTFIGLNSLDHPIDVRAALHLELGDQRLNAPPPETLSRAAIGASQRAWLDRELGNAVDVVVVSHHPSEQWPPSETNLLKSYNIRSSKEVSSLERSAEILRLERTKAPAERPPLRPNGFQQGRYRLGTREHRSLLHPAGLSLHQGASGTTLRIAHPPAGAFLLRFLVELGPSWHIETSGRAAEITHIYPATSDLCETTRLVIVAEIAPGDSSPLTLTLRRSEGEELSVDFEPPTPPLIVGYPLLFKARSDEALISTAWDFGDDVMALGDEVNHHYVRSGPSTVCALAIAQDGRTQRSTWHLDVRRWGDSIALTVPWLPSAAMWMVITLSIIGFLIGIWRGNIIARRRRLR